MKSEFKCVYCHQAIWQSDHLEWQGTERGEISPESYREQDVFWYHVARNVENDEMHFISKAKYGSFDQFDAEIWQTEKIGAFWQQLTSASWLLTCFNVEDGTKC